MFDVFAGLQAGEWFKRPSMALEEVALCKQSGHPVSENCVEQVMRWRPVEEENLKPCPYHKKIFLHENRQYRVNADCYEPQKMVAESAFVLPPDQERYYRQIHLNYQGLPPLLPSCLGTSHNQTMAMVYPNSFQVLIPTKNLSGKKGEVIFKAAHNNPEKTIYWHLNQDYVGKTQHFHDMPLLLDAGKHTLYLMDEDGNELKQSFEVQLP
jgi:penicillin-binding protein 1C